MEFKGIQKREEGKFITRYDITYETVDKQEKVYEMISRNKKLESFEELHGKEADAVVIIVTNETGERILLNKEFRLAVGGWVWSIFPSSTTNTPTISKCWKPKAPHFFYLSERMVLRNVEHWSAVLRPQEGRWFHQERP